MTIKTILLIYQDFNIRDLLQACLTDSVDWDVQVVSANLEGLAQAKIYQPDAIILDFSILEIDELLFKQLRNDPAIQKIPVVLLTTRTKWFDIQLLQQYQVKILIVNPLYPKLIPLQITNILGWNSESPVYPPNDIYA